MRARRLLGLLALVTTVGAPPGVAAESPILQRVAAAGQAAPGGGAFERFSIEPLPVVAPVNSRGQVAFFATLLRGRAREGFFRATGTRIDAIAAEGDAAPGGGAFSGFGRHPIPTLNEAGDVAFAAAVSGGKTVEGIFATPGRRLRAVAVAGRPGAGGAGRRGGREGWQDPDARRRGRRDSGRGDLREILGARRAQRRGRGGVHRGPRGGPGGAGRVRDRGRAPAQGRGARRQRGRRRYLLPLRALAGPERERCGRVHGVRRS